MLRHDTVTLGAGASNNSPIESMPGEMLADVFKYHRQTLADGEQRRWPVILRVCRRWREVAKSCATLWLDIATDNPDLFAFMLRYSQKLPVNISAVRILQNQTSRIEDQLMGHTAHIRQLELHLLSAGHAQVCRWVSKLFDSVSVPELHTLTLKVQHHSDTLFVAPSSLSPLAIRSLTLVNIRVLFSPPHLQPNITDLHFHTTDLHALEWKTRSVLETLSCLPNLVHLHLHDLAFKSTDSREAEVLVSLPKLNTFTFCGTAAGYTFLMRCLTLPSTTEFDISVHTTADPEDAELSRIYETLSAHLERRRAALPFSPLYKVRFGTIDEKVVPSTMRGPHHDLQIRQSSAPKDSCSPDHVIIQFRLTFSTTFGVRPGIHAYRPLSYLATALSRGHIEALELKSNLVYWETESASEGINPDGSFSGDFKFLAWESLRSLSLLDPCTASWIIPYIRFQQGDFVYFDAGLLRH